MKAIAPGLALGLLVGSLVGFFWAKKAKENASNSVQVNQSNGVVTVEFDSGEFVRGGLADWLK